MYKELRLKECNYNSAIKVRIFPSSKQKQMIRENSNIDRFVYNKYVELGLSSYKLKRELEESNDKETIQAELDKIKYFNSNPTNLHELYPWMKNNNHIDSMTKYGAWNNYKASWNMWRKTNAKPPRFKKRGNIEKYSTTKCRIIDKKYIRIPKLGKIRISGLNANKIHDELYAGKTTISKEADGKYYLSVLIGSKKSFSNNDRKTGLPIGLDMNVSNFSTDSYGKVTENPRHERKSRKKMEKEQRKLSRKYRAAKRAGRDLSNSKNYQKQRELVAKAHKKVSNQRKDFQHKLSSYIVKNHDYIFVEDLKVKNLMKNNKMARSLSDISWVSFFTMLEYKAISSGKVFMKVDPKYTTQTCSNCQHVMKGLDKIKLGVEKWDCPECQSNHDRDHNAAINIMNKGLELIK